MSRTPRKNKNGKIHHIIVQGINKEYIFENEKYKKYYIKQITNNEVLIIAYCIMDNHAHILICSDEINKISKYMQKINTAFAKFYNEEENRVGYVFKDRYKSEVITNSKYLKTCIAYIHNNPVKAGMVTHPKEYKFSSYNKYLEHQLVDRETINIVFGEIENYIIEFVELHKIDEKIKFLDSVEKIDVKNIINNYIINKKTTIEDIKKQKNEFNSMILEIIKNENISINKISNILGVSRTKIMKIINKNKE